MKTKQRTPNKATIKAEKIEHIAIVSKKTLFDYRLKDSELITLIRILSLNNFYVSLSATSKFLKMSEEKLKRIFRDLKALGYLEIKKDEKGNYQYLFKQESKYITDFKPSNIRYYSIEQLNALYNNAETPSKYKNLLKKYFDSLSQSQEQFNCVLDEIETYETPKDIYKKQLEKEREQANEDDILNYLKGNY